MSKRKPPAGKELEERLALRERALAATAEGVTISDPHQPGNPLIYANEGFERLTGYSVCDVIGRNCRFLQGPNTDPAAVKKIRESLAQGTGCTVQLLNYRKDGTPFWNRLSITPLKNTRGKITHFVGIQSDVTAQKQAEESLRKAKQKLEIANRHLREDLAAAAKVQRSLLPTSLPDISGMKFSWSYRPCGELGGDTLNVFPLDEAHVGLYILDVSGHGVAAALFAVTLSRLLSAIPGQSCLLTPGLDESSRYGIASPAEVAKQLNLRFQLDTEVSQYFTIVYGVLDVDSKTLRYVSAGHPGPVHMAPKSKPRPLPSTGPPIGLLPTADFRECELALRPGDRLFFYTDGVTEARNPRGEEFGENRLLELIEFDQSPSIEHSLDRITSGIEAWSQTTPLQDDISLLGLEVEEVSIES